MALHSSSHSSSHSSHSSSHSSHSSTHSSHSSSHASHANGHSNTAAHSNSDSVTDTLAWGGNPTGSHSVTATTVASTLSANPAGMLPQGDGYALTKLKNLCDTARGTMTNPNAAYTFGSAGVKMNQANLTALLNSAGGKSVYFRNGTIHINSHASHSNSSSGSLPHPDAHANTSSANTMTTANAGVSATFTAHSGGSPGTTPTKTVSYSIPTADVTATFSAPTASVSSSEKLAQTKLNSIASSIKKMTSSVASFGTYTLTGLYRTNHTNHSSHSSSHASHSNGHSNHVSHSSSHSSSHSNHSSSHSSHSDCSRLKKENITPITFRALDYIKNINLVSFNYKPGIGEDASIRHYGFIAEDTNEIFSTHYKDRMDYTNCIGILFKAVQELTEKIK